MMGFSTGSWRRDVDIVLLTQADVEDTLLPAGNLREPLSALAEADIVVLREEEAASLRSVVAGLSREQKSACDLGDSAQLSLGEAGEVALPAQAACLLRHCTAGELYEDAGRAGL